MKDKAWDFLGSQSDEMLKTWEKYWFSQQKQEHLSRDPKKYPCEVRLGPGSNIIDLISKNFRVGIMLNINFNPKRYCAGLEMKKCPNLQIPNQVTNSPQQKFQIKTHRDRRRWKWEVGEKTYPSDQKLLKSWNLLKILNPPGFFVA